MHKRNSLRGFTLIELMIVVAVVAVILTLAAPSFRDMILMQRLKGINAQLVSDLAFARGEAISRGTFVRVRFQATSTMTCYSIVARPPGVAELPQCDCTAAAGARCTDPSTTEIRTVQYPTSESVKVTPTPTPTTPTPTPTPPSLPTYYTIDPRTGGIAQPPIDSDDVPITVFRVDAFIDPVRTLRNSVSQSGRIKVCTPSGSNTGAEAC